MYKMENIDDEKVIEELTTKGTLVDEKDYADEVLNSMSRETFEKLFNEFLEPEEVETIKMRFGFYNGKCYTRKEIAEHLGKTIEMVRTLEENGIKKLRLPNSTKKLTDYYDVYTR